MTHEIYGDLYENLEPETASNPVEAVVSLRKFCAWAKTECDDCGVEYQVTRTEPREMESCICNDCEIYNKAYEEGFKAGIKSVKPRYLCKAN